MFSFYCPICGAKITNEYYDSYDVGQICPCCGNESEFDDDIIEGELSMKFDDDIIKKYQNEIESEFEISHKLTIVTAHNLLRMRWIKNGFIWKYPGAGKSSYKIGIDSATMQLKNINQDINDYLEK